MGGRRVSNSRGSWDSSRVSNDERQAAGSSSGDSMKSKGSKGSQGSKGSKGSNGSKGSKGSKGSNECTKVDIDQAFEALMVIHCNSIHSSPNLKLKCQRI